MTSSRYPVRAAAREARAAFSEATAIPAVSPAEERLNTLTHGLGLVLSLPALGLLLFKAWSSGMAHVTAAAVYGAALVLMYATSTFYHASTDARRKYLLRICDHVAIYVLIAGSYTPFMLLHVDAGIGWRMLWVVWGLALVGTIFKVFFTGRFKWLSLALYLGMGWMAVLVAGPMMEVMPMAALWWIGAGGLCYTGGVLFFAWDRLPYNHSIWHVFVLAGSACHYVAVLRYAL